jgi:hypothetical protein
MKRVLRLKGCEKKMEEEDFSKSILPLGQFDPKEKERPQDESCPCSSTSYFRVSFF